MNLDNLKNEKQIINEISNIQAALGYAREGIKVFPLCWPDKNGNCSCGKNHAGRDVGKVPLTNHGLNDGTAEEITIRNWWTQNPNANIGLVCGRGSGVFVVDVDAKAGGIESLAALESKYEKLDTRKILTGGGGFHFYFKYPNAVEIRNKPNIGGYSGIETRGAGGYVVAPPSLHRSGKRYQTDGHTECKDAPDWLIEMINAPKQNSNTFSNPPASQTIPEGTRNNTLTSLAGSMRRQNFPETAIYAALSETNKKQCSPPLDDSEVQQIVRSVTRYAPGLITPNLPQNWGTPEPFDDYTGPAFPSNVFPGIVNDFVEAQAVALQVPVGLVASLAIGVCAAAAAGHCTVRISKEWAEPLNVFVAVALPSGERKSPTFRVMTEPIEEREKSLLEAYRPEFETQKAEHDILETQLQAAKTAAAKAKGLNRNGEEMKEVITLSEKLANHKIEKPPRFIADDATSESVASLLAENKGRMAIMSTEGGLFETLAGRYSSGVPNIDVYLKGYSGDPLRVDRKSRPAECVSNPALTLCLTVQPGVICDLFAKPTFRGRGLLARFLYSLPKSKVGYRSTNPAFVPDNLRQEWHNKIMAILKLTEPPAGEEHALRLSPEADAIFQKFRDEAEKRLRPEGDLSGIADWGNKFPGNVARLAGILHLLENAPKNEPWKIPISASTIKSAIKIGDYYAQHALAAYGLMGADSQMELGRRLWAIIVAEKLTQFSLRDIYQKKRKSFPISDLLTASALLEKMGYIHQNNATPSGKSGRPPSPLFDVNPLTGTQNTHNPQNVNATGGFEDSEDCGYCSEDTDPINSSEIKQDDVPPAEEKEWGEI
jgi:hypothetical protein